MNDKVKEVKKMPPSIIGLLYLCVVVFVLGTIFIINTLFSTTTFEQHYITAFYFFYILSGVLIIATFSRCKIGWIIILVIGALLFIAGCIFAFCNKVFALFLIIYGALIISYILPPSSRQYLNVHCKKKWL